MAVELSRLARVLEADDDPERDERIERRMAPIRADLEALPALSFATTGTCRFTGSSGLTVRFCAEPPSWHDSCRSSRSR